MKPESSKAHKTRQRILETAERLFGYHGLEGVALRTISAAAGQGNNYAVQYHFKNKEGLISAIIAARAVQIEAQRHDLLIAAARSAKLDDVRTLLEIAFLPPARLVDKKGRHTYARFLTSFLLQYERWT